MDFALGILPPSVPVSEVVSADWLDCSMFQPLSVAVLVLCL